MIIGCTALIDVGFPSFIGDWKRHLLHCLQRRTLQFLVRAPLYDYVLHRAIDIDRKSDGHFGLRTH